MTWEVYIVFPFPHTCLPSLSSPLFNLMFCRCGFAHSTPVCHDSLLHLFVSPSLSMRVFSLRTHVFHHIPYLSLYLSNASVHRHIFLSFLAASTKKKGFSRPLQVYLLLLLHTCPVLHHTWSQSTPAGHTCQYESCARQCIFSLASVLLQQLSIQFPSSLLSHICHRLTPVSLTLTHLSTQML